MLVACVIVGFAVSLSVFHFLEGAMRMQPAFDRSTVTRLGPAAAALFFALCGPVLVLREGFAARADATRMSWPMTTIVFAALWAGLVGVVAVETGRLAAIA